MQRTLIFVLLSVFIIQTKTFVNAQDNDQIKKDKALDLMKLAEQEYLKIKDYQAKIISTERIDGKTRETEYIAAKFKHPNYIYLQWLPGPFEGMQASYVPSRDKANCFLAKETGVRGMIGTKTWSNDDKLVKMLYPHHFTIHQTSLAYFFETMQFIVKKATELNKLTIVSIDEITDKKTGRPVFSVLAKLSSNPKEGLKWSKVHLFFDKEQKLPYHFILYDFSDRMLGDYAFTNFRKNTGLVLSDFQIK